MESDIYLVGSVERLAPMPASSASMAAWAELVGLRRMYGEFHSMLKQFDPVAVFMSMQKRKGDCFYLAGFMAQYVLGRSERCLDEAFSRLTPGSVEFYSMALISHVVSDCTMAPLLAATLPGVLQNRGYGDLSEEVSYRMELACGKFDAAGWLTESRIG